MQKLLAFDYGASSGRAMLGFFDGNRLRLEEVHRFPNEPVNINGTLYWDVLRLFHEMKQGIYKCIKAGNNDIAGIGTDTWGVDFGLLDKKGSLIGNPVHYRDSRTDGIPEKVFKRIPRSQVYEETGIQIMQINTLYQLLSLKLNDPQQLEKADTLLFMPDLLNYFLSGEKITEYTIASTSQLLDARAQSWSRRLISELDLPGGIFRDITGAGRVIGKVTGAIREELGIREIPVIASAEHDTASAVVSVPASAGRYAYLSSGTWSLLGIEAPSPIINDTTYSLNYTNEGGFNRTTRLLKNIMGLWIYQECKRAWDKTGDALSFDQLEAEAENCEAFKCFIDPDDDIFLSPGNMPGKIKEFCSRTGQLQPGSRAETVRCILESLALKYRYAFEGLQSITGSDIPVLHIVGGGCRNTMLCRFTANALGKPVEAGPIEATAIGNIACQLIALGELSGQDEARLLIKKSFPTACYMPQECGQWSEAYERFIKLISGEGN